jgi:protein-S-isoprenylcysteine O-methyltransferase Ste14/uncharacterized membrane protein (UPF0127 family)
MGGTNAMHRATVSGRSLADRLRPAHTHWSRLRGLLGTKRLEAGEGLWIKPSNQIHMFGMRYALDVVFLDDAARVLRLVHALAPNRISPRVAGATSVLELPAGTLERIGLAEGDLVQIDGNVGSPRRSRVDVAALLGNVALAAIFGLFAGSQVSAAIGTGQWATTMPIALQETLLVVLFLTRRRCFATSDRPLDWIVGFTGTLLPLLMRPDAVRGPLNWLGEPLQFLGVAAAVAALSFLGRSFGVVAANRGVKTSGLYSIVRHPTYAGYMLSYVGYVMSYPTSSNVLVAVATLFAFNARAIFEERLLRRDPHYRAYQLGTPWRFVPYVY